MTLTIIKANAGYFLVNGSEDEIELSADEIAVTALNTESEEILLRVWSLLRAEADERRRELRGSTA